MSTPSKWLYPTSFALLLGAAAPVLAQAPMGAPQDFLAGPGELGMSWWDAMYPGPRLPATATASVIQIQLLPEQHRACLFSRVELQFHESDERGSLDIGASHDWGAVVPFTLTEPILVQVPPHGPGKLLLWHGEILLQGVTVVMSDPAGRDPGASSGIARPAALDHPPATAPGPQAPSAEPQRSEPVLPSSCGQANESIVSASQGGLKRRADAAPVLVTPADPALDRPYGPVAGTPTFPSGHEPGNEVPATKRQRSEAQSSLPPILLEEGLRTALAQAFGGQAPTSVASSSLDSSSNLPVASGVPNGQLPLETQAEPVPVALRLLHSSSVASVGLPIQDVAAQDGWSSLDPPSEPGPLDLPSIEGQVPPASPILAAQRERFDINPFLATPLRGAGTPGQRPSPLVLGTPPQGSFGPRSAQAGPRPVRPRNLMSTLDSLPVDPLLESISTPVPLPSEMEDECL